MPAVPDALGRERLSHGSGVLDVAGGRGHVAFELGAALGIRCYPRLLQQLFLICCRTVWVPGGAGLRPCFR